ncbi:MAG: isoleucine--tRNA ligase [Actinobacteria bacterium 21-64-8]|nr:MAG: isoleucine--tRNA ligase [Actinobacteria bacterium 21-64-8]
MPVFRPVSADLDFVTIEELELARWKEFDVFARSTAQREGAEPWVFYEGPPTANGKPGLHHVWARVYKDLFCRYHTMRGRSVSRRAGWDTHGLPVEVQVEKQLGISGKRAIVEEVGIAEFTRLCKESVLEHIDEFEQLTTRIGYWLDMDDAYFTFNPSYVESVWWLLKQIFVKGLLYEDLKVIPYCPRCGTGLSSHELGQPGVYTDEEDESAYVRLAVTDLDHPGLHGATHLAVWTTTPWTLLSNVAIAVNPAVTYAVVEGTIVAQDLVEAVFGEDATVSATMLGSELLGVHYQRPFDDVAFDEGVDANYVVGADYVTTDDGTGLVHQSPAFGEIDREVAKANGLPTLNPVGPDGTFTAAVSWLEGIDVRAANVAINDELEKRGLLMRRMNYVHALPHCWRCGTTLIYWGKPSWYIATSRLKNELAAENATIDWHPAHIRDGRMGEWLENNVDWALSRDRFWGTPLPIWRCANAHLVCVESRTELSELAGRDLNLIDPHRPVIDEVTFSCPTCGEESRRVEPVIDAWFDSGSMPAAQVGYPHVPGSAERLQFPAQFIAEAIDQTRGWFYSLLAVNTLVFGEKPYEHVLCLGHIVDETGKKMSKSKGNVIDPWEVLSTRGADALRWWMFSQGSPWTPTRTSLAAIDASMRETLATLWNTLSFFTTYASLNGFNPGDPEIPCVADRPDIDRWILSRLEYAGDVLTTALDGYEPLSGTDALVELIDDLSNWYVRRSRRRFWRTDPRTPASDSLAAQATLLEVLQRLTFLLAPLTPFLADRMYHELFDVEASDSVHLGNWPATHPERRDLDLEASMVVARRLTSLGRAARAEAGVKVRQPLSRALVFMPPSAPRPPSGVVEDELNVDELDFGAEIGDVLSFELVPNFRSVGPRLGEAVKELRPALAALDSLAAANALERGESISLTLSTGEFSFSAEDIDLRVRSQGGFAVSRDSVEAVALDLTLSGELRQRGLVRDVVRQIQDLRKNSGLDVADRIALVVAGLDDLSDFFDDVASDVLALSVTSGVGAGEGTALELDDARDARAWIEKV